MKRLKFKLPSFSHRRSHPLPRRSHPLLPKSHLRRTLTFAATSIALLTLAAGLYVTAFGSVAPRTCHIYIRSGEPADSLYARIDTIPAARRTAVRLWTSILLLRGDTLHPGLYELSPEIGALRLARNVTAGRQVPLRLTIPQMWATPDAVAHYLAAHLSPDAQQWRNALTDTACLAAFGVTSHTWPCLLIPNTYEVYWTTTPAEFLRRMQREQSHFWTPQRLAQAQSLDLTTREVLTLASIVASETARSDEYPLIARLYLNRLAQNMPLQADPTVKYAVGDLTLRRITRQHLAVPSSYNTYHHRGLPPGPIALPPVAAIDAVLTAPPHPYLYMCAKEDFSGRHNFAATYSEHLQNAHRYTAALNARGIH